MVVQLSMGVLEFGASNTSPILVRFIKGSSGCRCLVGSRWSSSFCDLQIFAWERFRLDFSSANSFEVLRQITCGILFAFIRRKFDIIFAIFSTTALPWLTRRMLFLLLFFLRFCFGLSEVFFVLAILIEGLLYLLPFTKIIDQNPLTEDHDLYRKESQFFHTSKYEREWTIHSGTQLSHLYHGIRRHLLATNLLLPLISHLKLTSRV